MLLSLALIMLVGFALSGIFQKLKLPGLLGMLLAGILLGPFVLNWISKDLIGISTELKQIALIIILTRAGLALDWKDIKKTGLPAVLLSFLPSTIEIIATTLIAPLLFGIPMKEAVLMGCVLAAVSPAVVIPRMLHLTDAGYGKKHKVPSLVMAGSSVDIVYVLILFTVFLGMYEEKYLEIVNLFKIPVSIISGAALGVLAGISLMWIFRKLIIRDTVKMILILSVSFLMVCLENALKLVFPFSGLLAVMALGVMILMSNQTLAKRLSDKFAKLWVGAELILFVLVGATVDISQLSKTGIYSLLLIALALIFRCAGVALALLRSPLSRKERVFCAIAYLPKATVQAAIGGIPLAMGIPSGSLILAVSVLAILVTAPLGAIGIDQSYKKLLPLSIHDEKHD